MIRRKDYPRSFKVGDSLYGLRFVRVFPEHAGTIDLDGYCCYQTQTIYIRLAMSAEERLTTVIHEILHAIDVEGEIGLSHPQIYKLEEGLLKFLIDNDFIP